MTKKTSNRLSPKLRERAVRMALDHGGDHASQRAAVGSVGAKITAAEWRTVGRVRFHQSRR